MATDSERVDHWVWGRQHETGLSDYDADSISVAVPQAFSWHPQPG